MIFSQSIIPPVHATRLKDGLKKYGKTGLYVYLGISFTITTSKCLGMHASVGVMMMSPLMHD